MKSLFWIIALLSSAAFADSTTVLVGVTHANLQPNGIWWQKEYPSDLPHNVASFTIRRDTSIDTNGNSIGIGYTYAGNFKSTALAVASDQAYAAGTPYPLSRWNGSQQTQGIFLAFRHRTGNWYVEGGPVVTFNDWKMNIPDWVNCSDYPTCLKPVDKPMNLTVGEQQTKLNVRLGAGYVSGRWSVDVTFFPTHVYSDYPGITTNFSLITSVGYRF